ncbi:MAG: hypothetical protein HY717_01475 [Planctomycetes bacterium]|nr:hypothetical protein [Planctomycetota bacterium]
MDSLQSTGTPRPPPAPAAPIFIRFLDGFFQERGIRWLLGIGVAIVLGSSLFLVTSHWGEFTPFWKRFILLATSAATFFSGEACRQHLGLRRTGTVLLALTLLLIPITFLAQHGLLSGQLSLYGCLGHLALFGLDLAFSTLASSLIFKQFLGETPPTFLASYLLLSMAGAFAPDFGPVGSRWATFILWLAFTLGAVKINRHVFWLVEERRAPRPFGFFPIALLGAIYFTLFALNFLPHLPIPWLGLAAILVAVPVLFTADAVARVFQERTGDLVRPLPRAIIIPLLTGIALALAGICLAAAGLFPPNRPYALVPAAALTAVLMGLLARRTGKLVFVWTMIALITVAYNFSPIYFSDLARFLVQRGAQAVREPSLPYAFYGLTYLPLLTALFLAGARLERPLFGDLFAGPLRRFGVGLAVLLLAASFTDATGKALFPVSLAMAVFFSMQTLAFRDRRLAPLAILAGLVMAWGWPPFASGVLGLTIPEGGALLPLALAAAGLLAAGARLDGRLAGLPPSSTWLAKIPIGQEIESRPCCFASLAAAAALAVFWLGRHGLAAAGHQAWPAAALLALLLLIHALIWLWPGLGEAALAFPLACLLSFGAARGWSWNGGLEAATAVLLGWWILSGLLERRPGWRLARAFGEASRRVSFFGLALLAFGLYAPLLFAGQLAEPFFTWAGEISWLTWLAMIFWSFDAARRVPVSRLAWLGAAGALGGCGLAFSAVFAGKPLSPWLPAIWAGAAAAGIPALLFLRRRPAIPASPVFLETLEKPIRFTIHAVLLLAAAGSIGFFSWPWRAAGLIALGGLLALALLLRRPAWRTAALALANWQIFSLLARLSCPGLETALDLASPAAAAAMLPIALAAAFSLLAWQRFSNLQLSISQDIFLAQRLALRALAAAALAGSLILPQLSSSQILSALAAFALLVGSELRQACRTQAARRVWIAEGIALAGVLYFLWFGLIPLGHGVSMYAVLAAAMILWMLGELVKNGKRTAVWSVPFRRTASFLPAVTAALAAYRHFHAAGPIRPGLCSLALLLAAGFYFWRGLEDRRKAPLIAAAFIADLAAAFLWRDLSWSDPQLYLMPSGASVLFLVEVLKREIQADLRNPLRYLGAVTILVSPVFNILQGSWLHLFTLMVSSVAVILAAIGLRARPLIYTGAGFLAADLLYMAARGCIDHPNLLWLAGLIVGSGIVLLGAVCENRREELLLRLRRLSEALEKWH